MLSLALLIEGRAPLEISGAHLVSLAISTGIAALCVLIHYEAMSLSSRLLTRVRILRRTRIVALIGAMLAAHVAEIWSFAAIYWWLSAWPEFGGFVGDVGTALDYVYFSASVYTTLGFGDITPLGPLRVLIGTEALVGMSMITWSASLAFLEMQREWAEYAAGNADGR